MTSRLLPLALIISSLVACGGGGSGNAGSTTAIATPTTDTATDSDTDTSTDSGTETSTDTSVENDCGDTLDQQYQCAVDAIANQVIAPKYAQLAADSTTLSNNAAQYCQTATDANLLTLRESWRQAHLTWQALQWVDFGPAVDLNNAYAQRIQFYTNDNDIATGVANLLARPETLTGEFVADQPVTAQGFPALEYLLFAAQSTLTTDPKACEAVVAISDNLSQISNALTTSWQVADKVALIANSQLGSTDSVNKSALQSIYTSIHQSLDVIRDRKLAARQGITAESNLSETSGANIKVNIALLAQLFSAELDYGFYHLLTDAGHSDIANLLSDNIEQANQAAQTLNDSSLVDLAQQSGIDNMVIVEGHLRNFRDLLLSDLDPALDIASSHNNNDGD